jgi:hypothetical protein
VLLHKTTDLLDSSIQDLVVPSSQRTMQRLIQDLVSSIESNAVGKDISDDEKRTRSGKNNEDSSLNGIPDDLKSSSSSGSNSYDKVRGSCPFDLVIFLYINSHIICYYQQKRNNVCCLSTKFALYELTSLQSGVSLLLRAPPTSPPKKTSCSARGPQKQSPS